ncbi:hypothetical protein O6H91_01G168000 [Diphasiastrum complanatum]|uniref:Uncharacterized protein n=1 Tax=Diphasiastrum complanatum TaxID=34168 RepID=A0ACC2EYU2_DIPCM|nr:hypothetical protein O6H91_01G168000 [Diphasiastrum complanatum]
MLSYGRLRWPVHITQNCQKSVCMGGCVGGFAKTPTRSNTNKAKNQKVGFYGPKTHQKDWWSSSETENNHRQSRSSWRSSSINGQEKWGNDTNKFINNAQILWHEKRKEWVGNRPLQRPQRSHEPLISWGATYNDLLTTSRPFTQPIPLPEMVDFLVDVWEQEGLYD